MNLLVVDTDSRTSDFLKSGLKAEGYCVDTAHSGKEALLLASTLTYQLMILDILLPNMSIVHIFPVLFISVMLEHYYNQCVVIT